VTEVVASRAVRGNGVRLPGGQNCEDGILGDTFCQPMDEYSGAPSHCFSVASEHLMSGFGPFTISSTFLGPDELVLFCPKSGFRPQLQISFHLYIFRFNDQARHACQTCTVCWIAPALYMTMYDIHSATWLSKAAFRRPWRSSIGIAILRCDHNPAVPP
jgi:hypothetical protein